MNNWNVRDIIYITVIVFNLGFSFGIYFNHIRHNAQAVEEIKENIKQLFSIANDNRDRISRIEGVLNNRKR